MYTLLRQLLFALPPEQSHRVALMLMEAARLGPLRSLLVNDLLLRQARPVELMGLTLPSPVGLAAGLDKDAAHIDALAALGFGFIEVGTLTPRPQPGNPQPRLFRLRQHEAIINRMGFNNGGIDAAVERIRRSRFDGVLGVNIGKNIDTPVEKAADDYLVGMQKAWEVASYLVVNLSSPNTPGLRTLQFGDELLKLLALLKEEQQRLTAHHQRRVPLAIKIAPDLTDEEVGLIASALLQFEVDGVIATNTTLQRTGVDRHPLADEAGGLSGAPLQQQSTHVVRQLSTALGGRLPIVGVGGICSAADALEKKHAGADAVQLYSGFIYRGPALIAETAAAWAEDAAAGGKADV
ncbi:MAG: quinone-dependent dihydroorotate dehydrogenase [Pseudohongiellaceae bacterium]